jgi:hypothetical protein
MKITRRGGSPDHRSSSNGLRLPPFLAATLVGGFAACALFAAGCGSGPSTEEQITEAPLPEEISLPVPFEARIRPADASRYVDETNCAGCHKGQASDHAQTTHAISLRKVSVEKDGQFFEMPAQLTDDQLGATYAPQKLGKELRITGRRGQQQVSLEMQFALGSGHSGVTYMGKLPGGAIMMPRIQRFHGEKGDYWGWTPSLEPGTQPPTPLGAALPHDKAHKCFGCHATTLVQTEKGIRFEASLLGVQCQRCHGPAKEHLAAVAKNFAAIQSGKSDPAIPQLGKLTVAQRIAQCESCHRPLDVPAPGRLPRDLARLQGVALRMSRCFKESGEGFACSSCHSPHKALTREPASYEQVCKSCHTGEPDKKACKLKRDSGCVGCHMGEERLSVFGNALYHNHWIRKKPWQVWEEEPK